MDITSFLQGETGAQIINAASQQLGIGKDQAQSAVSAAVPLLLSALKKNAQSGDAENIDKALANHNGSILDNLTGFLSQEGTQQEGFGILNHILGSKQDTVANSIGEKTGLDSGNVTKILALVAPVVMGYLGKEKQTQGLDSNGISGLLNNLSSSGAGIDLGGLEKILDQDGDGKLGTSDVFSFFGKFLKK